MIKIAKAQVFTEAAGPKDSSEYDLGRSSVFVTALTALNMCVVFIVQLVVAAAFGAGQSMDAYFLASALPNMFATVLVGSLNVTLIPAFIGLSRDKGAQEAWQIMRMVLCQLFLIMLGAVAVIEIFAPSIVGIAAPTYSDELTKTTIILLRLSSPSILFMTVAGFLTSLWYANHRFVMPGLAAIANNLSMLLIVFLSYKSLGVNGLALALTLGAIVQSIIALPIILSTRGMPWKLGLGDPEVRNIFLAALPLIVGAIFYKSDALVGRALATSLSSGSVSYLGYGNRIATFVLMLGSVGISTSVFPRLARHAAKRDYQMIASELYRAACFLSFLVSLLLIVVMGLRIELLSIFLERGAFTTASTTGTAAALLGYAGFIYAGALAGLYSNAMYSLKRVYVVVTIGVSGMVAFLILATIGVKIFGFLGIAYATSLVAIVNLLAFQYSLNRLGVPLAFKALAAYHFRLLLPGILSLICLGTIKSATGTSFGAMFLAAAAASATYVIIAAIVGIAEAKYFLAKFSSLLRRQSLSRQS